MKFKIGELNTIVYIPQNVLITLSGAWKLAGFGFAVSATQTSGDSSNLPPFHYAVSGTINNININFVHLTSLMC